MILGIDAGATTTDFALLASGEVKRLFSCKAKGLPEIRSFLSQAVDFSRLSAVGFCNAQRFNAKRLFGVPVVPVSEINAIARGGAFLSKSTNCVVVSMGTGTCIVEFDSGKARHLGGTGVGGGTVLGLSRLLLGIENVKDLEGLAAKGDLHNVDLSVGEVVGSSLGLVPANATASNFAKLQGFCRADLALGIMNMVGEVIAIASIFCARGRENKKMVLVGRTAGIGAVKRAMDKVARFYGHRFFRPKNFGFATAIGAALEAAILLGSAEK